MPNPKGRRWLRRAIYVIAALAIAGFVLHTCASAMLFDKSRTVLADALIQLLNRAILLNVSDARIDPPAPVNLCTETDLSVPSYALLYGTCDVVFIQSQEKYCSFWWMGRSCVTIAMGQHAYENEVVNSRTMAILQRLCKEEITNETRALPFLCNDHNELAHNILLVVVDAPGPERVLEYPVVGVFRFEPETGQLEPIYK